MTTASDISATPGRFSRALLRMFMKHAQVTEVETIAEGFRLITLESPEFKGLHWTAGQKVQIAMGSAFIARTFTPIEWDARAGKTRILGYVHGAGPASAWIGAAKPGDECDVFGPRASLDTGGIAGPRVLFGDETSIGLAHTLSRLGTGNLLSCLFEVNAIAPARDVLARLDLDRADLIELT